MSRPVLAALLFCAAGCGPSLTPGSVTSLAVLPFRDDSPQRDQEVFCDALHDTLSTRLGAMSGVGVTARGSGSQYRYRSAELTDIREWLGVDAVLDGSLEASGDRVTLSARVRRAADGQALWSHKASAPARDALRIADETADALAAALGKKIAARPSGSPEDADHLGYYAMGRSAALIENAQGFSRARRMYSLVLEKTPQFLPALAAEAEMSARVAQLEYLPAKTAAEKAKEAAEKVLKVDPSSPEGHLALGNAAMYGDWDWSRARQEIEQAVAARPSYAFAINARGHLKEVEGDNSAALADMELARRLDPFSQALTVDLIFSQIANRKYDDALALVDTYTKSNEKLQLAPILRALALYGKKDWNSALRELVTMKANAKGWEVPVLALLGPVAARAGKTVELRSVKDEFAKMQKDGPIDPVILAGLDLATGNEKAGFDFLDKAVAQRSTMLLSITGNPVFEPWLTHPRFRAVLEKVRGRRG